MAIHSIAALQPASTQVTRDEFVRMQQPIIQAVNQLLKSVDSLDLGSLVRSRLPTVQEKEALAGTGTPSASNKYVTADWLDYTKLSRVPTSFTPSAHASSHNARGSDALAIDSDASTGSLRTLGTSATSAAAGNHTHAAALPAAHQLDSATYHSVSGLTTGHFLKATGATSFGFAAHGLTHGDVGADAAGSTTGIKTATNSVDVSASVAPGVAGKSLVSTDATHATWQAVLTNPMTTLGDTIYGGASGAVTRLPGLTTNGTYLLGQTVAGNAAQAPAWVAYSSTGGNNTIPISSASGNLFSKATGEWPNGHRFANATTTARPTYLFQRSLGTLASPTVPTNGTLLGGLSMAGWDGTQWCYGYNGGVEILGVANETWSTTNRGTYLSLRVTQPTTIVTGEALKVEYDKTTVPGLIITGATASRALRIGASKEILSATGDFSTTGGANTIPQADANSDLATLGNLLMTKTNAGDTTIDRLRLKYDANWEFALRQHHTDGVGIGYEVWNNWGGTWKNPITFGNGTTTLNGTVNVSGATASRAAAFDASKNIVPLDVPISVSGGGVAISESGFTEVLSIGVLPAGTWILCAQLSLVNSDSSSAEIHTKIGVSGGTMTTPVRDTIPAASVGSVFIADTVTANGTDEYVCECRNNSSGNTTTLANASRIFSTRIC